MLFKWILLPYHRAAHARLRACLLEQFHKNQQYGSYERSVVGLEYLLMPQSYGKEDYHPLDLSGQLEARSAKFEVLLTRLEVIISQARSMIAMQSSDWRDLVVIEELKQDKIGNRWKDLYFGSQTQDGIRKQLHRALTLLKDNEACFESNFEMLVTFRKFSPILLRELEDIVEHFL